jgi:hypothetical protein
MTSRALQVVRRRQADPGAVEGGSMPRSPSGLVLVVAGLVLVGIGLLVWSGGLSWFGRLPGDIRIERPNTRIYIPVASSLLISVVLSLVLSVIGAILRRFR